jgi:hypothetical protein
MSAMFVRTPLASLLLSRVNRRPLKCVIALAFLLLCGNNGSATTAEHHIFLVDVSGSMLAKPLSSKSSHFELRKNLLKKWLKEHPDSAVTLISFASDISAPSPNDLPDSTEAANRWVEQLKIEKRGGTHLWDVLKKAVDRASELIR